MLNNLLREPLLHFLFIGAVLFYIYSLQPATIDEDGLNTSQRIVITESNIDRLIAMWEKRMQRPPTSSEFKGLIEQQIREEVLNREALSLGLEKDDSVIRRRLAQKMEFIFDDIAAQAVATETQLSDYLKAHPEKFEIPGRISFNHIYYNNDTPDEKGRINAQRMLEELIQIDSEVDITTAGDVFMFGQQFEDLSKIEIARLFGEHFAEALFSLPLGRWQGPVSSGYGLHLVKLDQRIPAVQPELEAVREKVLFEWESEQRREMNQSFYRELREKYDVVVEDGFGAGK